jgi:esterase/lipase superfamily enzyme
MRTCILLILAALSAAACASIPEAFPVGVREPVHVVEVFFGTDRVVEKRDGVSELTAESSRVLTYGVAEVSIPPKHEVGRVEAPAWWRFEVTADPQRHLVYRGASLMNEDAFFDEVRGVVEESGSKQAFVFIHGFNTSFEDAALRTAQIHHDLGFDGAPIFYSWPSEGSASLLAYVHDGNAADRTAPRLEQFLMLVAERTGADKIHLIAHSMGNRALVTALDEIAEELAREERSAPFNQIVLAAPDIDREVFLDIAAEIPPTGTRVTLYASTNDHALALSKEFNGAPRAGDSTGGVVIVNGLNTVDASDVRTELFDIGHDYFSQDDSILQDIGEVMATNAEPAERGLEERLLPPRAEVYWAILRGMFAEN